MQRAAEALLRATAAAGGAADSDARYESVASNVDVVNALMLRFGSGVALTGVFLCAWLCGVCLCEGL